MKTKLLFLLTLAALAPCGCSQQRSFDNLRTYLGGNPPNGRLDAAVFAANWVPVVDRTDYGVPFLLKQTQSPDPVVAITAYLALEELVGQVRSKPTPTGEKLVKGIDPHSLAEKFASFPTNGLAPAWLAWYQMAHEQMMKNLEPTTPPYSEPAARSPQR